VHRQDGQQVTDQVGTQGLISGRFAQGLLAPSTINQYYSYQKHIIIKSDKTMQT
jgi:hypothetical protein